jgi:hypothetical protein
MFRYEDMDTVKGFIVGTTLGVLFWAAVITVLFALVACS